ncbi:MAG: hypothetical protein HYZ53_01085 [Planctomycetes bacterium]|nr:hypothetical protein [Planctomycetota bacterium]
MSPSRSLVRVHARPCACRVAAFVLPAVVVFALAAGLCGRGFAEDVAEKPVPGDWLVRRLIEPGTLNPFTATDSYETMINANVYDSLLDLDPRTYNPRPWLAERWEVSDDHLTYTFHLRKDVRFHDGRPMTAEDVVFSFNALMNPEVQCGNLRNYYLDVKEAKKLDDFTVQFLCSKPYFQMLDFLGGFAVLPKHVFAFTKGEEFNTHKNNRAPIGTGAYKFLHWKSPDEIAIVRNEDFWGEKAHLQRIVFKFIPDGTVAFQVLLQGSADRMNLLPDQWQNQTDTDKFKGSFAKQKYLVPSYTYLGWNQARPFFKDKRVRQALTMLVDRQKMVDKIFFGLAEVATGPFFLKTAANDAAIKPWPFDPERAEKLLEEAGWTDTDGDGVLDKDGVAFRFELNLPAKSVVGEKIATVVKEQFRKSGIDVTIKPAEWAVFIENLNAKRFDACFLSWSMGYRQDPYQIWHSSQADVDHGSNRIEFRNKEVDDIIEKARLEFDEDKRNAMYRRLHGILHDEQPYTFLLSQYDLLAVHQRFRNVGVFDFYRYGVKEYEPGNSWWVPSAVQKYKE